MASISAKNLRQAILAKDDIRSEKLYIEEWDTEILVRGLSGKARAIMLNTCMDKDGNADISKLYPFLIVECCYDPESRERIFEDTDKDIVFEKSGEAQEKIAAKVMDISGLNAEAKDTARKN